MAFDTSELFDIIKKSVDSKSNESTSLYKEILKFGPESIDKKFILRLVPYVKEGREGMSKTFSHFIKYSWKGTDGMWKSVLSPRTNGETCSISNYSYRIRTKGSDAEISELRERLFYKEGWYVNAYVISDPVHPENNGTMKILSIGKKMNDYIVSALNGALDDEWTAQAAQYLGSSDKVEVGKKIFDLGPNGVNLVLSVTKNSAGFNDYSASKFVPCSKNQSFSEEEQTKICDMAYDVTQIERVTTDEENMELFRKTYLDNDSDSSDDYHHSKIEVPDTYLNNTSADTDVSATDDVSDFILKNLSGTTSINA